MKKTDEQSREPERRNQVVLKWKIFRFIDKSGSSAESVGEICYLAIAFVVESEQPSGR